MVLQSSCETSCLKKACSNEGTVGTFLKGFPKNYGKCISKKMLYISKVTAQVKAQCVIMRLYEGSILGGPYCQQRLGPQANLLAQRRAFRRRGLLGNWQGTSRKGG